jgi:outer membrane protein assembly factor BamD (BamD/ComL family)
MKMRYSLILILAGAGAIAADSVVANSAPPDSRTILYDRGIKLTEAGKLPAARRTLETLVNTWPKSVEATEAKYAIDAMLLFEDGQARLRAGKYGTAGLAFRTLLAVYPESPLVPRAADAMSTAERLDQAQSNTRTVRSLRFENVGGVKIQDILQRWEEREIELGVEKPCTTRMLEAAKAVLGQFLAEKGFGNARVEVNARDLAPRSVEITFRVVKN